uniref:Uncharacterized protein n=1 Tax=Anguilla anguilla TaxID=7936 RepID=A0A0E9VWN9_ANGAN
MLSLTASYKDRLKLWWVIEMPPVQEVV